MRRISAIVLSGLLLGAVPMPSVSAEGALARPSRHWGTHDSQAVRGQVDWPTYRFDNARTGVNPYETLITKENVHSLSLAWSQPIGSRRVFGRNPQPIVAGGAVYASSYDGLSAFDVETGTMLWRRKVRIEASPTIADGVLFVGGSDRGFAHYAISAIEAATGVVLWKFPVTWVVRDTPVVSNGVVYVLAGDGFAYALDSGTGAEIWSRQITEFNASDLEASPAIVDGLLYLSIDGGVEVLRAADGTTVWKSTCADFSGEGSPTVVDGVVYVGAGVGFDGLLCAFDAETGELLWASNPDGVGRPSPVVHAGVAYVVLDNKIFAFDASSGALLWSRDPGLLILDVPSLANGVLYVRGYDMATGFDADTGDLLWKADIPSQHTSASPVVVDGRVFVSMEDEYLYVFELP